MTVDDTETPLSPEPEPSVATEVRPSPDALSTAGPAHGRHRKRDADKRGLRQVLILGIVAAVLVAAGLAFNRSSGSDEPSTSATTAGSTAPVVPRSDTTRVYDRFDRSPPAHSLGRTETGQLWAVIGPAWSVIDGEARVDEDETPSRTLAVVREAGTDGIVQVKVAAVEAGAGLVFRFQDFQNYWSLTAAPRAATWNLQRVVDGESTIVGNVGTVGASDGTTIAVRFQGAQITVLVGGIEQRTFEDGTLSDVDAIGLTGYSGEGEPVRFDDFAMNTLAGGAPQTTPEATEATEPATVDG